MAIAEAVACEANADEYHGESLSGGLLQHCLVPFPKEWRLCYLALSRLIKFRKVS